MQVAVSAVAAGLSGACLIPPDLEPATGDAGPSATPVILSAQPTEFDFPGPVVFERGDSRILSLEVEDGDRGDTLYVRLYIDYNRLPTSAPTPYVEECQAAPIDSAVRLIECDTNTICNSVDTNQHVLEAMVTDRPFILDSDPAAEGQLPYRAVAEPQRAAFSFSRWLMSCVDAI